MGTFLLVPNNTMAITQGIARFLNLNSDLLYVYKIERALIMSIKERNVEHELIGVYRTDNEREQLLMDILEDVRCV
mgnify:CR=1 FL=1